VYLGLRLGSAGTFRGARSKFDEIQVSLVRSHWSGFRMARKKVTSGGGDVTAHCTRRILMCALATVVLLASLQITNGVAIPEAHKLYIVALHA
jgi:hypothetical protein